jgi:two-component system, NarL family, nitrate/nitrite response regulator NarL
MTAIRTLVVSEVHLHREGLASALAADRAIRVVGAVASVAEARRKIGQEPVDIVLLDLPATDEHLSELAGAIRAEPRARFVALGPEGDGLAWVQSGAAGMVDRDSSIAELRPVLETIMRGEFTCSPRLAAALVRRLFALSAERRLAEQEAVRQLTPREMEMLVLVGRGLTNKEIATCCSLRVSTVKNHVHSILEKLGVRSRAAAAVEAQRLQRLPAGHGHRR